MSKKKPKKGQPQRRNRQEEVIDAAIKVFWKKGYSAASIQDVADHVGVLKGSLYYYIDSKEDLLFRIFDESHRQAMVIIEETAALEASSALDRLAAFFERWLLWYLRHLERVSLYFNEWRYLTGARRETVIEQRKFYEKFVRDLIIEAQAEGSVPTEVNPKLATFFLLGAINAVPTWYRANGPDRPEQIAETYRQMVLSSLSSYQPSAEFAASTK